MWPTGQLDRIKKLTYLLHCFLRHVPAVQNEQALDRFDRHEEDVTTNNAIKKKENNWKTIRAG